MKDNSVLNFIKRYSMIFFLVIIIAFFQMSTNGIFLSPVNVTNIVLQNSHILILAIGMLMIIVLGHIDLSVGSVAAFTGAISAILMITHEMNPFLAMVVSLFIGALIGAWQGFWVAYMKIPAFIVTLAGMLVFRGLTIVVLGGRTISNFPNFFRSLSSGFIANPFGGEGLNLMAMVIGILVTAAFAVSVIVARQNRKNHGFEVASMPMTALQIAILSVVIMVFSYTLASHAGVPNVLLVLGLLIFIYHFVTTRMKVGRYLYAIGGNEKAANLSGIKTKAVIFWTFVNMGVLAALSGLVFSARLNAATAAAGNLFELNAIAACFIGGASASGGVGKIKGAIMGGLIMAVINNGMSLLGVGVDWQQAIMGLILLMAVALDVINKRKLA